MFSDNMNGFEFDWRKEAQEKQKEIDAAIDMMKEGRIALDQSEIGSTLLLSVSQLIASYKSLERRLHNRNTK